MSSAEVGAKRKRAAAKPGSLREPDASEDDWQDSDNGPNASEDEEDSGDGVGVVLLSRSPINGWMLAGPSLL